MTMGTDPRTMHNDNPDYVLNHSYTLDVLSDDDGNILPCVDAFTRGYAEAMLWANTYTGSETESDDNGYPMFEPIDALYMFQGPGQWWYDIGIDYSDAIDFLADMFVPLDDALRRFSPTYVPNNEIVYALDDLSGWEQHGHDFALTRNHHGAGFWDRGYGVVGDNLTDAAQAYGSHDLYLSTTDDTYTLTNEG